MLDFFPSWRLTAYLAKTFVVRILGVLALLVVVLLALDLLATTGEILAVDGNGQAELLRYAGLRVPQLVTRFLPYAVLLASVITLLTLNQNSEVVAMKAAGLSAHQILAPLMLAAAIVSVASFAFNEAAVTRATASLKAWQAVDYGAVPAARSTGANVYVVDGADILLAASVTGAGAATQLNQVTYFERSASRGLVRQYRGKRAVFADPGWRIVDAQVFDVIAARSESAADVTVGAGIDRRATCGWATLIPTRCRSGSSTRWSTPTPRQDGARRSCARNTGTSSPVRFPRS